jgi:5-methylcytosine-specific restriction endonuclease McrA
MAKERTLKIGNRKYPSADKIGSRSSTIARSMASTLMPRKGANASDCEKMAKLLYGLNKLPETLKCVYCGRDATHLDHLHPLIDKKEPTGYFTEPANLVPCCSSCNQKKGNDEWDVFMKKTEEKFKYLNQDGKKEERITRLRAFVKEMPATKLSIDEGFMEKWRIIYKTIIEDLDKAQQTLIEYSEQLNACVVSK